MRSVYFDAIREIYLTIRVEEMSDQMYLSPIQRDNTDTNPRLLKMVGHLREKYELEVFLDTDHLGNGNVNEQLTFGIKGATVFISFLTEKYVKKMDRQAKCRKRIIVSMSSTLAALHHGAVSCIPEVMEEKLRDPRN